MNAKIAESLIQQMSAQIELFISLALGICGGLFLLAMQIMLHNQGKDSKIIGIKAFYLWVTTFALEGLSICAGALSRAAITSVTPVIYHLNFSGVKNWTYVNYAGSSSLNGAALFQIVLFFCGMITLLLFVIANRDLIRREVPREKKR